MAHSLTVDAELRHRSRTKPLWENRESTESVIEDVAVANEAYTRHMEALEAAQKEAARAAALAHEAEERRKKHGGDDGAAVAEGGSADDGDSGATADGNDGEPSTSARARARAPVPTSICTNKAHALAAAPLSPDKHTNPSLAAHF